MPCDSHTRSHTHTHTHCHILTDNIESNEITAYWLRRYLALVHARIPLLRPLYLQRPVISVLMVCGLKPLIGCVCVRADGEYVYVAMPYPGDL